MRTKLLVVEPDPEPANGEATVLRVRVCLDCGELLASREQLAPLAAVQRRLRELAGERVGDGRRLRKALASAPPPA